jgi:hypothetical protein
MIQKTSISDVTLFECSVIECPHVTVNPQNPDPRLRWAINLELKDEEKTVRVNLCPQHVRELLFVDEDFFDRLSRTERFVKEPESDFLQ